MRKTICSTTYRRLIIGKAMISNFVELGLDDFLLIFCGLINNFNDFAT